MKASYELRRSVGIAASQGISVELRHALPAQWKHRSDGDHFVVEGPMFEGWKDALWSVARFVAHDSFVSLNLVERADDGRVYELLSSGREDKGFLIRFVLTEPPTAEAL